MENMHANVAYPCIVNVDDHVRVYQGGCFCPDIADLSYQKITFVITAVRFANTIDHGNQIALLFPKPEYNYVNSAKNVTCKLTQNFIEHATLYLYTLLHAPCARFLCDSYTFQPFLFVVF